MYFAWSASFSESLSKYTALVGANSERTRQPGFASSLQHSGSYIHGLYPNVQYITSTMFHCTLFLISIQRSLIISKKIKYFTLFFADIHPKQFLYIQGKPATVTPNCTNLAPSKITSSVRRKGKDELSRFIYLRSIRT